MAANTKIEWAEHTFNPWVGCQKVGPACEHCYAEGWAKRSGQVEWGPHAERRRTSAANWRKPLMWNEQARAASVRPFVFCASLADVFDSAVPAEWRRDLFALIRETPHLTWLLLTKRPGNIVKLFADTLPPAADKRDAALRAAFPENVVPMATVVTQEEADRDVAKLLAAKAILGARVVGLSMEPLLGSVNLRRIGRTGPMSWWDVLRGEKAEGYEPGRGTERVDWVIAGGESGPGARPVHPYWLRDLRDQCAFAGVPFLFKQWGEHLPVGQFDALGFQWAPDAPSGIVSPPFGQHGHDGVRSVRLGKVRAGRMLDGRIHDERPVL